MIRTLRWIAGVGLGVGAISLAISYALDRSGVDRVLSHIDHNLQDCRGHAAAGTGPERHLAWSGGDSIDIAMPATVRYRSGEGSDVVVRGAPDVISHVELRGGRLTLDCRWHAATRDIDITLPAKPLRRVSVSGSGRVVMEKIDQPELKLLISGSGSIAAQGSVGRLDVTISGAGKARLGELATKQLTVEVSGSGNVEAAPTDEADIRISGSGKVSLLTRPQRLDSKISGSGRISQPPLEAAGKK